MQLVICQLFDRLQKSLTDEPDRPSPADTAHEFGMTESAVRQASYRLRQRYRQLLREEIAHTVMAAWRYRGRTAPLGCCAAGVTNGRISCSIIMEGLRANPSMKTATTVCERCGAKIPDDATGEVCPACLLETGLGVLD